MFRKYFKKKIPKPQTKEKDFTPIEAWRNDNGDLTHRLNYDLKEHSIVFDLGGYEGWFAARIFCKYLSKVFVFEPNETFYNQIKDRFKNNKQIEIFNFGLDKADKKSLLYIDKESSSLYKKNNNSLEINLKKASTFILDNNIKFIDLMKINIEGGEYDLLLHLIDSGLATRIKNIQVQFHDFVPDAKNKMTTIQEMLKETHKLTYQYYFIWENWTLKLDSDI